VLNILRVPVLPTALLETNNLKDKVHLDLEGQEAQTSATQGEF
jgi:hypothetical protein